MSEGITNILLAESARVEAERAKLVAEGWEPYFIWSKDDAPGDKLCQMAGATFIKREKCPNAQAAKQ